VSAAVVTSSDGLRQAIRQHETELRDRTGQPLYRPFVEHREELARAVDGLDLTPAEWRHLEHRLHDDYEMVEHLASIIWKAREQGEGNADHSGLPRDADRTQTMNTSSQRHEYTNVIHEKATDSADLTPQVTHRWEVDVMPTQPEAPLTLWRDGDYVAHLESVGAEALASLLRTRAETVLQPPSAVESTLK
jgi:hypothetical protein